MYRDRLYFRDLFVAKVWVMKKEKEIKNLGCMICSRTPSFLHHIKTRGSGGDNSRENLAALCLGCHSEVHQIGAVTFFKKHSRYREILEARGWRIENGKLILEDK